MSRSTIRFAHRIWEDTQKAYLGCSTGKDSVTEVWLLIRAWLSQGLGLGRWGCFRNGIVKSMRSVRKACKGIVFYKTEVVSWHWTLNSEDLLHDCWGPKLWLNPPYLKHLPETHKIKLSYPKFPLFQLNNSKRFRKFKLHSLFTTEES